MNDPRGPVLHFIDTTGPGGAETVMLQVADGMRGRGWPGRVVLTGPGWVLDHVRDRGLPADIVETRGRFDLGYVRRIVRLVRQHGAELIHAHLFSPSVYASIVGAWTGVPVIATFHGVSDVQADGWARQLRHRLVARRAEIVCVSESLRSALAASVGVPEETVRVIHNGLEVEPFGKGDGTAVRRENDVPGGALLVGSLGNLRPAKDLHTYLRAADILGDDARLRFAVAGQRTEPLYGRLLELRARLGLDDRVSFWGFRSDVPEVLAAFDVLVISSASEGFSLAALQAMAAGTPVVATRSGGPEEIITDGVDGLLVPTGSPEALAGAVRRVIANPELASRLAAAALRTVRERFSLGAMLDAYESTYAEITGRREATADRSADGRSAVRARAGL